VRWFALFAVFYGVGAVGHLVDATRPLMLAMTPFFLPAMGMVALSGHLAATRAGRVGARFWGWAAAVFVGTWAIEVIGVATGIVFGTYEYGRGLGAPVFGVPPVIGFNWVLVCLGMLLWVAPAVEGAAGSTGRTLPRPILAAAAAALATGFDWVMEPVAIALGYWSWGGGGIPVQNYAAWFAIAFGAALSFLYLVPRDARVASRRPAWHVAAQLGFFAALRWGLAGG
jgi:bisanhydrobacterioruberin hydratase